MDTLLVHVLLWEEHSLIFLAFGLIMIGASMVALFVEVNIELRRVSYALLFSLASLAISFSPMVWPWLPQATELGLFTPLFLFAFGSYIVFGMVLFYASAGRAIHMGVSPRKGWLVFVPFGVLFLLFPAGKNSLAQSAQSGSVSKILDPILACAAVLIFAASQTLLNVIEESAEYDVTQSPRLQLLFAQAQSLEESFALEARLSEAQLPLRLDDTTVMTAVDAEGRTLRITNLVEERVELDPNFKSWLAEEDCSPTMFEYDLRRGGRIHYVYELEGGEILVEYEITYADCIF